MNPNHRYVLLPAGVAVGAAFAAPGLRPPALEIFVGFLGAQGLCAAEAKAAGTGFLSAGER